MTVTERTVQCKWDSGTIELGVDEAGNGASVVLLPALSSISTKSEMRPLLARLASQFQVTSVDWPGFGERSRPKDDWSPDILSAFLNWFLSETIPPPHAIVAAGHAATYALFHAAQRPGTISSLVLIAPTWRGPFPTMMNGQRPWFAKVRTAIDLPVFGPLLYRLNVSRYVVGKMAREHVYSDPAWLTEGRLAAKLAVTRAPGARHGSVRFVSGGLDRVESREDFLALARQASVPILVICGHETPTKSRAEMQALASLSNVEVKWLPRGKLAIHEEFPDAVASLVAPFLEDHSARD